MVVRRRVWIETCGFTPLAGQPHDRSQTRVGQSVERVVDGREAHRRKLRTKTLEEILRCGMRPVVCEETHDRDALGRKLEARPAKIPEHVRCSFGRGAD